MTANVFPGELKGPNGLSAKCLVTTGAHGYAHISDITPPLPDRDDYELHVNGLKLKARITNSGGSCRHVEDQAPPEPHLKRAQLDDIVVRRLGD
jgi:hypothetical protein